MNTRRGVASGFLAAVLAAVAPTSWAQPFPNKPIRLIVPDAPGGAPDILARLLTQKISEGLGQQVIVDNRPGAAGQLAAEAAARAAPDGYTLFMSTTAVWAILPSAKKSLPYDSTKAFVPITRIATTSNVLVVSPSLPVDSVAGLIQLAKASPGNLTYASAGVGSPAHLAGEMLAQLAQIKLTHVPYKGAAPALLDVLGGSVQMMVTSPAAASSYLRGGKLRALATSGVQRNPALPDLPTIAESLPGYEITQSWGIAAPAGTAPEIVRQLHAEITRVMGLADVRERVQGLGVVPLTETPQAFTRFIAAERARLGDVIRQSGIELAN
jgi:tripartite-type tricarboxylate transporter receptor subunit TctC